jgi:hypothetical protein
MAGDWIKMEMATPDKPEVFAIADRLGIDPDAVVGKLVRLWVWADNQSLSGNALTVTFVTLDRITFCSGFAAALVSVGWLNGEDGNLSLPNFDRHYGKTAKARAVTGKRVSNHRANCNGDTVTDVTPLALPEKRREEKNTEGERNARGKHQRPTLEEAKIAAKNAAVTPEEAEKWWHKREAADWMRSLGGGATGAVGANWQSDMTQWVGDERQRKADAENRPRFNGNAKPAAEPVDHSKGFFTEGQPSKRNQNSPQSHQNAPQSLASVAEGRDSGHGKIWL